MGMGDLGFAFPENKKIRKECKKLEFLPEYYFAA
jgi:hypothetical protein